VLPACLRRSTPLKVLLALLALRSLLLALRSLLLALRSLLPALRWPVLAVLPVLMPLAVLPLAVLALMVLAASLALLAASLAPVMAVLAASLAPVLAVFLAASLAGLRMCQPRRTLALCQPPIGRSAASLGQPPIGRSVASLGQASAHVTWAVTTAMQLRRLRSTTCTARTMETS
jgi:hypothetical protein